MPGDRPLWFEEREEVAAEIYLKENSSVEYVPQEEGKIAEEILEVLEAALGYKRHDMGKL